MLQRQSLAHPIQAGLQRNAGPAADLRLWMPLLLTVVGFYCFFGAVLLLRMRLEVLKREARSSWAKAEIKLLVEKGR